MNYTDIKKGMVINYEDSLYLVIWCQNHKPGKGGAIMRTKLKNLMKGTVKDRAFRGGDTIEQAYVDKKDCQLLYRDGDSFVFMDNESFEQYTVNEDIVGDSQKYLKDEMICTLHIHDGDIILVEAPMFVELEIIETDPGLKGDTASGGSKPAKLETGATVQVPLFVQQGEKVKVDTRDDRYIERVK